MSQRATENFIAESVKVTACVEHVQVPGLVNFVTRCARVPCGDAEVGKSFIFVDNSQGIGARPVVFAGESLRKWECDGWFVD